MKPGSWRSVRILLAATLALVTIRAGWIFYQRRRAMAPPSAPVRLFVNPDFYVYAPKAYLSDFQSAQALKGSAVWVRDGYRYPAFPYDARTHRSREITDPPLLPPFQKITIADIVPEPTRQPGTKEINLVFEDPGASPPLRAVTIGHCSQRGASCRFYLDEMFFLKDPRQLYTHWDAETWKTIERHEAREGMTEAQISLALGYGRVISDGRGAAGAERAVEYRPPGRAPLLVTFDPHGYARHLQPVEAAK